MPSSVTENVAQPERASQADKGSLLPVAVVLRHREEVNVEAYLCSLAKLIHTVLGIERGVVWTRFLNRDSKHRALPDAELFALPSYSENSGVVAVGVLASGILVIVSDQVGIHHELSGSGRPVFCRCLSRNRASGPARRRTTFTNVRSRAYALPRAFLVSSFSGAID